ncbi:hypothetical protein ENKO_138 [Klebsiella phage fENko-Kae01]|nr:hypothetical protein CPT_Munch_140 [Salmonella phage Munch]QCW18820.1 hypothetical protein 7t3_0299 [Salmonella phage 7t3]WNV47247.1 hypothetical protein [Klebsiella phage fENko-Kae01]
MTFSNIDDRNMRIHYWLRWAYERTEMEKSFQTRAQAIHKLVHTNKEIHDILMDSKTHTVSFDVLAGVSQTASFERYLTIIATRNFKYEISSSEFFEVMKLNNRGTWIFYSFNVPCENSKQECLHILSSDGVYVYRGALTFVQ